MHSLSQAVALYLTPLTFFCLKFISLLFQLMYIFSIILLHRVPSPLLHLKHILTLP